MRRSHAHFSRLSSTHSHTQSHLLCILLTITTTWSSSPTLDHTYSITVPNIPIHMITFSPDTILSIYNHHSLIPISYKYSILSTTIAHNHKPLAQSPLNTLYHSTHTSSSSSFTPTHQHTHTHTCNQYHPHSLTSSLPLSPIVPSQRVSSAQPLMLTKTDSILLHLSSGSIRILLLTIREPGCYRIFKTCTFFVMFDFLWLALFCAATHHATLCLFSTI